MDKEDIVNYVMNTPDNTNPAVLRGMLDQYNGGGDAGMLVANIEIAYPSFEATCDKTVAELKAAYDNNIPIMAILNTTLGVIKSIRVYVREDNLNPGHYFADIIGTSFTSTASTYGGYEIVVIVGEDGVNVNSVRHIELTATVNDLYTS